MRLTDETSGGRRCPDSMHMQSRAVKCMRYQHTNTYTTFPFQNDSILNRNEALVTDLLEGLHRGK